jgi:hypothetical protein
VSKRIACAMSTLLSTTRRWRLLRGRAVLLAPALAGVVGLGLFASACGNSAGSGLAQLDSTQTTTSSPDAGGSGSPRDRRGALVAFAACMRQHGVPSFPDPKAVGRGYRLTFGTENGIDVSSPGFKNAQKACKKLLPGGGTPSRQEQERQLREALEYARCMRSHGMPDYPDPTVSGDGGIVVGGGPKSSADPDSPRFNAAEKASRRLLPGAG